LVILSPDALESPYVRGEINVALRMGRKIIPVIHRKCDVPLVVDGQQIDFRFAYKAGLAAVLVGHKVKSTPSWVRLLQKFGVATPIVVLAIMTGAAILSILPSKTSVT